MENQTSLQEIINLYKEGQRLFRGLDIEGDLSNQDLNGISFEDCFIAVDFKYSNLSYSKFKNGSIKTSDFRYSDLTKAEFMNLAVESTQYDWAITEGLKFKGNYCYGQEIPESDFEKLFKTNSSKPKFKVIDTFKITNRGIVICGDIIEGKISVGDSLKIGNRLYEITGVEMIDKISERIAHVGLVIPVFDKSKINQDLHGKTIEITKKNY